MKLQTKIILTSTLLLFVLLVVANSSIYFIFKKTMTDNAVARLQIESKNITEGLKQVSNNSINKKNLLRAYLPPSGMIRILPSKGIPLFVAIKEQVDLQDLPYSYEDGEKATVKNVNNHLYAIVHTPVIWSNGDVVSLEVTEQLTDVERSLQILKLILIIASLAILIPTMVGGRILSRIILLPIQSLIQTMEDIEESRTFKKIIRPASSKDELDQMANTFNSMMDLLEENYKKQEQFVSDASHELKTPLTVIESYANMLKRWGMKRPDILEEAIEAIHSESIRMKQLTEQMLLLAKGDVQWELKIEQVDIAALCRETAKYLQQAFQRNILIHVHTENAFIRADEKKIKQLLYILVDNAVKYSETPVDITINRSPSSLSIAVTDYGIGIPKEDLAHVYERFFRVDKARTRATGGSGLGLPIARRIVAAHQGDIHIKSEEGTGTTVTVIFPV
ncbi:HAMP domain-containing sensor histidine kinase [Pseudobacillus wudalianchiensis]|uniref:Signal transduction histidine-protein kinase ArlS n=1 Tax=Pseudobacillus wudalianchiensis TaxID=1743143 RepID=A0A1B9B9V5_9BACI|nr:HAMP domain-containing histidine kinase [Bacillus wudalianchiensis]OCA92875.1 two-component sensor histidine kinase [Bacillus wudalianchiensis]